MPYKKKILMIISFFILLGSLACANLSQITGDVSSALTDDPAEVAERGQAIVSYTMPEGFSGQTALGLFGMDVVFLADGPLTSEASSTPSTTIMLAQIPEAVGDQEMEAQARQAMAEQSGQVLENVTELETREIVINDQLTTLSVKEGQTQEGETVRLMNALFTTKSGAPGLLLISGKSSTWNEAAINQFLSSLQ